MFENLHEFQKRENIVAQSICICILRESLLIVSAHICMCECVCV